METQNIVNLLNNYNNENSKFATKKGILLTVKQKVITYPIMKLKFEQVH